MPTLPPPWEEKAKAADNEVLAYKGLTKKHVEGLKKDGVDVSAFEAAQKANTRLQTTSADATQTQIQKTFASCKILRFSRMKAA